MLALGSSADISLDGSPPYGGTPKSTAAEGLPSSPSPSPPEIIDPYLSLQEHPSAYTQALHCLLQLEGRPLWRTVKAG